MKPDRGRVFDKYYRLGTGPICYPHNQLRTTDPQAWSTVPCIVAQPLKNKVAAIKTIIDLVMLKVSNYMKRLN